MKQKHSYTVGISLFEYITASYVEHKVFDENVENYVWIRRRGILQVGYTTTFQTLFIQLLIFPSSFC